MFNSKIKKYLLNPRLIMFWIIVAFPRIIKSDKLYLKIKYYINFEKWPNLDNPQTFSEKIQWLKLYDRKPEYIKMVDKIDAKEYVASIIGRDYIIPTLAVYEKVEEIDFDALPNQFVLKCSHDSGGIAICRNKQEINKELVIKKLRNALKRNFFWQTREWPYKNVSPRIIAEVYMQNDNTDNTDLLDYKFFCFNGEPKYCQVISDRSNNMCIDFFDEKWNHQPFHEPKEFPFSKKVIFCPQNFQKMLDFSRKISASHPFLRVDFYEIRGALYFGEITFYPTSGIGGFSPEEWDLKFGKMIDLTQGFS